MRSLKFSFYLHIIFLKGFQVVLLNNFGVYAEYLINLVDNWAKKKVQNQSFGLYCLRFYQNFILVKLNQRSQTCGPRTSGKMKTKKEIWRQYVYFLKTLSLKSNFFIIFLMWPASPCFQSHAARDTLWVWDPWIKRSNLFNWSGFIESFSESKLSECQDPIVLTSTVNGYCLVDEHCRNLEGTFCSTASDQVTI